LHQIENVTVKRLPDGIGDTFGREYARKTPAIANTMVQ
jgi:hypothetical protein